jgi:transcriptional regulator with XRE-family HTH domain
MADSQEFARAFGDALNSFFEQQGMSQFSAARELGIDRARLNTYCRDSSKGKRATPSAEILYLLCIGLGFEFEYKGYRITASKLDGSRGGTTPSVQARQLPLDFEGEFALAGKQGTVSVNVKRPAGRIEVSLSLKTRKRHAA